jgi:hypothetical protein
MWQDQTQQGNSKQTLEKEKRRHSLHNSPCHTQPSHRNHAFTHHVKRTLCSNHVQPNQLPQTTQHHEHKRIIQGYKTTSDISLSVYVLTSDCSLVTGHWSPSLELPRSSQSSAEEQDEYHPGRSHFTSRTVM